MKSYIILLFFLLIGIDKSLCKEYFQQEVRFTISVTLDDVKNELNGTESFDYINNSPDALSFIYIHLWANGYKDHSTALCKQMVENGNTSLYFAKDEDKGFIDQLDFKVNGESVHLEYDSMNIDIAKIILNKPLKHGETITISTPFHVKIPLGKFSRMGHLGQSYQISQWYPKPAVYDRNGWNQIPYLDQGEFYSEFGTFDVNITLPKNYVVGATGDLVNGEQEEKWMTDIAGKTKTIEYYSDDSSFPESDKETKTLHYHQEKVHDFAWFADKRYHVLKGEITLPHSNNKVTTWVLFTNYNSKYWRKAIPYIDSAIYYYSLWNGDYPYHQCTAVDGALSAGGGMEYPNVTVIGSVSSDLELEDVIVHEVGHNWFYGMLGSNERRHAWMDEGINSFYEFRYLDTVHPLKTKDEIEKASSWLSNFLGLSSLDSRSLAYISYLIMARKNLTQPIDLPADEYTVYNYDAIVYMKTAMIFKYLMAYLGEETFDKCMKAYFETWKYKHPMPEDIKQVVEKTSGKNLDWFFNDLLETDKKIDYKICKEKADKSNNNFLITIKNNGDVICPFSISGMKKDSIIKTQWYEGFAGTQTINFPFGDYDKIKIDADEIIPEINRRNNTIRTHGLLKKVEPLQLKFLGGIENPDRTQLYWTPVVGFNKYNGLMPGLALYNTFLPEKNLEYIFVPMYSTAMKSLAGTGNVTYAWHPDKSIFQNIKLGVAAKSYAYMNDLVVNENNQTLHDFKYIKIQPELTFDFKKDNARSPVDRTLSIREINIIKDIPAFDYSDTSLVKGTFSYHIFQTTYSMNNHQTFDPYSYKINVEGGAGYSKVSGEFNYSISYNKKGTSADIRFFAGKFVHYNPPPLLNPSFSLSGIQGYQDYLFDNTYLGRSEYNGILSDQIYMRDGDFKVGSFAGQTNNWLATMNTDIPLFGAVSFIHFFFDAGTYRYSNAAFNPTGLSYDGGFSLCLVKKVFVIYFPLFYSNDIETALVANGKDDFKDNIRFVLNIDLINPLNAIKNLSF